MTSGLGTLLPPVEVVAKYDSDGVSGEMTRRSAHPALAAYLTDYCGYEERATTPLVRREAANGGVNMIISFGDEVELLEMSNSPSKPGPLTTFVAGLHAGHASVQSRHQRGIQLDLTPLGAYRLLGLPMREIANQVVPLDELRGSAATEFVEQLAEAPSWAERFALVDRTLLAWADEGPAPDSAVQWAWDQIATSHGKVPVSLLSDEIGWSHRHFVSRFRNQVGLPPKPTSRVMRFRRAVDLLVQPRPATTITDVAVACGYADHSHLVREFQALAGCSPSAYFAAQLPGEAGFAA